MFRGRTMARPQAEDGIRAKVRVRDGIQLIHFAENPGRWIASPEKDRKKAIAWAKRNRNRVLINKDATIANLCEGFFSKNSDWVRLQKDKGRKHGTMNLKDKQAYLTNYFSKTFGHMCPADIEYSTFRGEK